MVRFHWHVENGFNTWIPPGGIVQHKEGGIRHASCNVEVPSQKDPIEACMTLPVDYMQDTKVKEVGIVLGHGLNAAEWKGKFLTDLACALAADGYIVMRYHCKQKEQRRVRDYEKALDACATSPFARGVERWVFMGFGNGARVAAVTAARCRGVISGLVLMSYPLLEPLPGQAKRKTTDAGPINSEGPLLPLTMPVLFIHGESDKVTPLPELQASIARMASPDVRLVPMPDADGELRAPGGRGVNQTTTKRVLQAALQFVDAVTTESLQFCTLPRAVSAKPAAAGAAPGDAAAAPTTAAAAPAEPWSSAPATLPAAASAAPGPAPPLVPAAPMASAAALSGLQHAAPQAHWPAMVQMPATAPPAAPPAAPPTMAAAAPTVTAAHSAAAPPQGASAPTQAGGPMPAHLAVGAMAARAMGGFSSPPHDMLAFPSSQTLASPPQLLMRPQQPGNPASSPSLVPPRGMPPQHGHFY